MSKRGENRRARVAMAILLGVTALSSVSGSALAAPRRMEALDRGLVAVPAIDGGVLVSWRLLGDDPAKIAFNLYRDGAKLNAAPLTGPTDFVDEAGGPAATYIVRAVVSGQEAAASKPAEVWANGYLSIPIQPPPDGVTPDGEAYSYTANDASVGDLDGDGRYEIVLKWDPTNSKDNAFGGYTGSAYIDAYTLEGRRLWRIDLGRNIRAGAHYAQFQVYDLDGDGRAEVAMRTSDGTVDGTGQMLGDPNADWRGKDGEVPQADRTGAVTKADGTKVASLTGRILKGPEYLTVFDGLTGKALASAPYSPPRDPRTDAPTTEQMTQVWGDGYANRSDRFLAATAYLDGQRPSLIFARGYYGRTTLAAWDWRDGKLTRRWLFDSAAPGNEKFGGQGNHQLSVADVDGDGRDEIIYGSMAVDDDGKGLWSAELFHGDAMHVGDLDPTRPGLEKFGVHESPGRNGGIGAAMLDARTGKVLWTTPTERDTGRGLSADMDPRFPGEEAWGSNSELLYTAQGKPIDGMKHPRQTNFAIWWDGDDLRELLDRNQISKWDWKTGEAKPLLTAQGVASNNGTKATPALSADILGDWREEVIWRAEDNHTLRIYATPYPTQRRLVTLMHDPQYRLSIAWQNTAYNQPPHTSFYLGEGMKTPAHPDIRTK
ncbi:rhamnogalacturonan lyase [Caulobacter sp. Root655]|uniref:rhamnogalacturonan lyase n=1 Tax=Caulobacter sp. Root655 TaxID=1736578 RepID=UPI000B2B6E8C|nr:rhamnogalacturonan lyase [Caulobacter sp. Root655]